MRQTTFRTISTIGWMPYCHYILQVHFVMNNPLRTTLTNVQFSAESDGLLKEPVNLDMGSLGSAEKLTGMDF